MPKVHRRPGATAASQATRARRRKAQQFGSQAELCRQTGCCVCTAILSICTTRDEHMQEAKRLYAKGCRPLHARAHHEPPRGVDNNSGDENTVPLCDGHHTERHSMPAAEFWGRYALDPEQIKARLRARLVTA